MTQQNQEQVSIAESVIDDGTVVQYDPIPVPANHGLKTQRLLDMKATFETRLQTLITEASRIRQMSTGAKTDYKRKFYDKKFVKVNKEVRETVLTVQQLQYMITKAMEGDNAATRSDSPATN